MHNDEAFMPKLHWEPRKGSQQIYEAIVDCKPVCVVQMARLADKTSVWKWSVDPSAITQQARPATTSTGEERAAWRAVRSAENAYNRLLSTGKPVDR